MSGGCYDYAYQKVEDFIANFDKKGNPVRELFAKHLNLVAKAMHDIEWVDSHDYEKDRELQAILETLYGNTFNWIIRDEALSVIRNLVDNLLTLKEKLLCVPVTTTPTSLTSKTNEVLSQVTPSSKRFRVELRNKITNESFTWEGQCTNIYKASWHAWRNLSDTNPKWDSSTHYLWAVVELES